MLVIRGTKKLRDRIAEPRANPDDASTTVLGDWFGTALFWKPQVAMLVNQRTLLPVFLPLAPAKTLLTRAPDAIADALRQQGAGDAFIAAELEAMSDVRIAPTNDRSTVGVMNELGFMAELRWMMGRLGGLHELSAEMARTILGPLKDRGDSPDRALAALLDIDPSKVAPFPRSGAATAAADARSPRSTDVYQLKVTIKGTKPPIWRRVLVDGSSTLAELHEVIQAAFGWWNSHLYEFEVGRARYKIPDPDFDFGFPVRDVRDADVADVATAGATFTYIYDFGDSWEHSIAVEKILDHDPERTTPACIGGRRAGPPDDCGGTWGYENLLAVLADPSHEQHEMLVEWMEPHGGAAFDPEAFDPDEFADRLRAVRATGP